ncbi:MAG: DegT/DnrJ/EryC1/StrS family aminotransferase [Candidatus Omnitrophica bacterium]|nr:DegT/DnrJ/EryC1/StrS family aminotransferase [Candidatus Omnitrophota bacterium]
MSEKLAIDGGSKAKTTPNIPMYPGGMEIGEEEKRQALEVLDRKYLFRYYGPSEYPSKVSELEDRFSKKIGAKHCLAVNSCTSALISGLVAAGVGPGDEVIVSGYTFFASCAAIVAAKAIPVICEIDDSLTMDPDDFEKKINKNTKAVIAVHMRGAPCDMDRIKPVCKKYGLKLIEDAAQSCGGSYKGKMLGTFGDVGCFSFQYHKIITAGEGGACLTDDDMLYDRLMGYHDTAACWRPNRFEKERYKGELFCGVNYRMSELTGAVMLAQLGRLDSLLERMRANKKRIKEQINGLPGVTFRRLNDEAGDTGICLIFMLNDRNKVSKFVSALQAEGIAAAGVFNKGIPDWHIYSHWNHVINKATPTPDGCPYTCPHHKGKPVEYSVDMCPKTDDILSRAVHFDIPPQMSPEDCDMIANGINKVAKAVL